MERIEEITNKVESWEGEPCLTTEEARYLLSLIETQKKEIDKHKKAFKDILDFYGFDEFRIKRIIEDALKQE